MYHNIVSLIDHEIKLYSYGYLHRAFFFLGMTPRLTFTLIRKVPEMLSDTKGTARLSCCASCIMVPHEGFPSLSPTGRNVNRRNPHKDPRVILRPSGSFRQRNEHEARYIQPTRLHEDQLCQPGLTLACVHPLGLSLACQSCR